MKLYRIVSVLVLVAVLLPAAPRSVSAAPAAQSANLLVNGGLDSFNGDGTASSWLPWWQEIANPGTGSLDYVFKPDFAPEANPNFVLSGSGSQHVGRRWDPWYAGIRQTISVTPGSVVHFAASGRLFASNNDWPAPSDGATRATMRIGVDPNGGIDWASGAVVWSGADTPHDRWAQFTLDVTAGASGKMTLFLANSYRGDSRFHLDAWWDNASATVVTAGSEQPTASSSGSSGGGAATAVPVVVTPFATPTPGPDGNIVYTVQSGDTLISICINIGRLDFACVDEIKKLNNLTSDILSVGQRLVIGQGQPSIPPTNTPDPNAATAVPTSDPNQNPAPTAVPPTPVVAPTAAPAAVGKVCALVWNDVNGNGFRDTTEGLLAGGQIAVVDVATGQTVQTHVTDGQNEPYCFDNLPAGEYTVSAAAPSGYNPTRASSTTLRVEAGTTSSMEFGAQSSTATNAAPAAADNSRLRTALLGAAGVVFLLLAAGVAGFFFLRRR